MILIRSEIPLTRPVTHSLTLRWAAAVWQKSPDETFSIPKILAIEIVNKWFSAGSIYH